MEIARSARKHQDEDGFSDADINHVVEHALYAANDGDEPDMVLYLGPDQAGRLLEVVTVIREDEVGSGDPCHEDQTKVQAAPSRTRGDR